MAALKLSRRSFLKVAAAAGAAASVGAMPTVALAASSEGAQA